VGTGRANRDLRKSRIAEPSSDLEFVLSDATVDRYGDVVEPSGWEPASLKGHVSALFNHDAALSSASGSTCASSAAACAAGSCRRQRAPRPASTR
jgi:hypothetical protein